MIIDLILDREDGIEYNPHDFGNYPSFEIDYSPEMVEIRELLDDLDDENSDEYSDLMEKADAWHEKADQIDSDFGQKFSEFL